MNTTIEEFEKWLLAQEKPPVKGEMTLGKINEYRTHMCRHAFEGGFNAGQAFLSQGELIPIAYLAMTYTQDINAREDGFEVCSKFDSGAFPVYISPPSTEALQKDNAELFGNSEQLKKDKVELIEYANEAKLLLKELSEKTFIGEKISAFIWKPQPQCMQGE